MRVARTYQISHSQFLAWSQDDRDKAIWFELREAERCPNCRTRPAEWDPEQGGDHRAYIAKLLTCRGCQAMEDRQAAIPSDHPGRGQHITLARPEPEPPAEPEEVSADEPESDG